MNKLISFGAIFILGVGAGWILQGKNWDSFVTSYIPVLATLLAAFYGAKFAFQFQNDKEIVENKKRNLLNANNSIFTLMRMANKLFIYQRDFINPVRNSPVRFIEMRPTPNMDKQLIKLNIEALYFMLESDDKNLLGEVVIEEERYRSVIDIIDIRSQYHIHEVQPLLEKAGFITGGKYTFQEIETMLGPRLYMTMQQTTDDVIKHLDDAIISIKQVSDKLTTSIKRQYPNEIVISFVLPS